MFLVLYSEFDREISVIDYLTKQIKTIKCGF